MPDIQLTLVLLATYWAGTNVIFAGIKLVNEVRDKILSGQIPDRKLTEPERRQFLRFDWLPAIGSLSTISLLLGLILLFMPELVANKDGSYMFEYICRIASVIPFCGFLFFIIRGISEYHLLRRAIKGDLT